MGAVPEQRVFAVVILGSFNPAIFHPFWYVQNGLFPEEEVSDAVDVITSDQVSTFRFKDVHFQIERHRFGLTTKDASKAAYVRDLAMGSFSLLEHTPLTALGLNLDLVFNLPTTEAWHDIGHRLAPKEPWKGIMDSPGMRAVVMEGTRRDCLADKISVRVQPIGGAEDSVLIAINQHYDIETEQRRAISDRIAEVTRILSDDWTPFCSYAERAAIVLLDQNHDESAK